MEVAADSGDNNSRPNYLSSSSTAIYLALVVCYLLWRRKEHHRRVANPLDRIPGPRGFLGGNWLNLLDIANKRNAINMGRKWCAEAKGSLMRLDLGPIRVIFLLTPENVQKVLGSGDIRCAEKSYLYSNLKMVSWFDGVLISKGEKWKSRRKLIMNKLSYGNLLSYIQPMNECSRTLVSNLETLFQSAGNGEAKEIEHLLFDSTFRTLCKTVFGIDNDDDYERYNCDSFIHGTARYLSIVEYRGTHPWLSSDLLFRLHPMSTEMDEYYRESRQLIEHVAQDHLDARAAGIPKKPSLMKDLLDAGLSLDAIYEEVHITFFGGYDTTGNALHYLFFLLALNPKHQDLCHQEVDMMFENADLCPHGEISLKGLKRLVYLEQCVLETLRLLPPVFGYMRDLGTSVVMDDKTALPAGTTVAIFAPAIHMNPKYYPDPETFDPNRFTAEERQRRSPYCYLPFSAGPRGCLGYKFGMNEMLITAARVLRHFEISTKDKLEDVVLLPNITMTPETPMKFMFKKRII